MINLKESKTNIRKELLKMHAYDIAKFLFNLESDERKDLIAIIPSNLVDNIFSYLEKEEALIFFEELTEVNKRILLDDLSVADLKPLFEELDKDEKDELLTFLRQDKRKELEQLIKYDETLAASIMRSDYITIDYFSDVKDSMKKIISEVRDTDFIDDIFVLKESKLIGVVSLKDLIVARKEEKISDISNTKFDFIKENETLNTAIDKISNYDLNILPVVNLENNLIGVITADDVLEEMALDYESNTDKFVAVGEFDDDSSAFKRSYQRLPWLLASIVLNLLIASFLSIFSGTIEKLAVLVLFQPLILGMAGNIGTQAIAVTILKIHNKETKVKKEMKNHIRKEVLIGLVNALIIGVLGILASFLFLSFSDFAKDVEISNIIVAIAIGLSLFFSMFLSALFGVFIPIMLDKIKIDPALASGPIISTVNDLVALVIYFQMATLIILPLIK